jgi:hypothetical protein
MRARRAFADESADVIALDVAVVADDLEDTANAVCERGRRCGVGRADVRDLSALRYPNGLPVSGTLFTPQLTGLQVLSSRHRSGDSALRVYLSAKERPCRGET